MKLNTCAAVVAAGLAGGAFVIPVESAAQEKWTDSIAVKSDVRLRYESIHETGEVDRNRGRFRARLGLTADVNDNVKAILQFATGGDNPVSTNQSFDSGFSRKDIGLDLAYLDWTPNESTHIYGGKMKNPFHRAGGHALIWDSDLNPEGVALAYEKNRFFGVAALMFVEERSTADDSLLTAIQGGYQFDVAEDAKVTAGLSYYDYSNTRSNSPFHDGNPRGNSVDPAGNLLFNYSQLEFFAELSTKLGDFPVSFFADLVQNSDAPTQDSGFAIGAAVGKASTPGTWQASLAYQDLEADAVIATFTDSDFGGGGTDASGFVLKGKYALVDNWALGGTLFLNDVDDFVSTEHDYTRLQLDLEFKF